MTSIQISLEGDNCWPELKTVPADKLLPVEITGAALLPDGEVMTLTGDRRRVPVVVVRVALPDGGIGLAQVKLEMWEAVARAMRGRLEFLAAQHAAAKGEA